MNDGTSLCVLFCEPIYIPAILFDNAKKSTNENVGLQSRIQTMSEWSYILFPGVVNIF